MIVDGDHARLKGNLAGAFEQRCHLKWLDMRVARSWWHSAPVVWSVTASQVVLLLRPECTDIPALSSSISRGALRANTRHEIPHTRLPHRLCGDATGVIPALATRVGCGSLFR